MKRYQNWFNVKEVLDGVYAIDDNGLDTIYFVTASKKCLLIDTGFGVGSLPELVSSISSLPLTVINTHGHPDHADGDYQFPEILISPEDTGLLKENCFELEERQWALQNALKEPFPDGFSAQAWLSAKCNMIRPVKHGETIDLGGKVLEIAAVPGHTPGCIALLDRKNRILFSGDSILAGPVWMFLKESTSLERYLKSMKYLWSIRSSFDLILPAHAKTPVPAGIIGEMAEGVADILEGRIIGKYCKTFAGEGLLCKFGACGIIYDNQKLFC